MNPQSIEYIAAEHQLRELPKHQLPEHQLTYPLNTKSESIPIRKYQNVQKSQKTR